MDVVTNANMFGVEVSVLIGRALDWAVEQCGLISKDKDNLSDIGMRVGCSPSTNWVYGGPIIERELIQLKPRFLSAGYEHPNGSWEWRACLLGSTNLDDNFEQDGPTPLIAAMRCYVASKLGKYIYIPEVLKHMALSKRSVAVDLSDDSTTGEMSIVPADLRINAFKEPINIVPGKVQLLIKRQVVDFYPCTFSMGNGPMWAGMTNAIDGGLLQLFVSFHHNPKTGRLHVLPNTLYFQKRSEIVKPEGDEGSMLTDLISNAKVVSFEYTSG